MGLAVWLNLKGTDVAVFVVCGIIGLLLGFVLPAGAWSVYVPILVSYHLFLGWLVVTAEDETGFSLPVVSSILTHLACMILVVALGLGRHAIPFFGILRYSIAAMAIFERKWLFSGRIKPATPEYSAAPVIASTGDDYEEWLRYLAQNNSVSSRPGGSLKAEYEKWVLARAKAREVAPSQESS